MQNRLGNERPKGAQMHASKGFTNKKAGGTFPPALVWNVPKLPLFFYCAAVTFFRMVYPLRRSRARRTW